MKQATAKKSDPRPIAVHMGLRLREGLLILSTALAIFLVVSFVSYHTSDPGWSSTGLSEQVNNWGGRAGAFLADMILSIFGFIAYLLPPMLVFAAWVGINHYQSMPNFKISEFIFKLIGFALILLTGCGLVRLYLHNSLIEMPAHSGGILGDVTTVELMRSFNITGSVLLLLTGLLCGLTLFTGISWLGLMGIIRRQLTKLLVSLLAFSRQKKKVLPAEALVLAPAKKIMPVLSIKPKIIEKQLKKSTQTVTSVTINTGMLPPLTLLNPPSPHEEKAFSSISFEELSQLVEQHLADFGVSVKVVAVHPGPVITRFELDLAPGIKVSKITGLAKDIARSLSVTSVRVVEVIPGKSVIGLELPNEHRELLCLRDILESERYQQSLSPVSLVLGKDIAGYPVVVDLAKMPHLLVAGTTGAGKSVSLNAMLLSMLFKADPSQLRLIMIDPKMLELSVYEGIPHLLTPVITDMKDAANALRWCVAEMDRRYKLMSALGVRNLSNYNNKVVESSLPTPEWLMSLGNQPPTLQPLPVIVVVIDELADMMMVVGKKVEDLIARIAQKARAAGIHLIVATQRPSVDVITGLIKANIPTRVAFQVSSRIDSRTILDQQGAEQLLGNGDMLYLPPGTGVPVRVHGAYVADEEVHRVVAAWKTYAKPAYLEDITSGDDQDTQGEGQEGQGETDPLYDEALAIVTESRRASISLVQRRLRIGYNRAARIMEEMEAAGCVSPMDGSGTREVIAPPPPN